jgi:NaMN:DMB phosphoribosyltransferase
MEYTKEITTPVGKHVVVIKTMLTGAERETVTSAPQEFVKTNDGTTFEVTDMKKMALAEKHALLRASLVSIDGDITSCFERTQKMFEADYDFIYENVLEVQKKMKEST